MTKAVRDYGFRTSLMNSVAESIVYNKGKRIKDICKLMRCTHNTVSNIYARLLLDGDVKTGHLETTARFVLHKAKEINRHIDDYVWRGKRVPKLHDVSTEEMGAIVAAVDTAAPPIPAVVSADFHSRLAADLKAMLAEVRDEEGELIAAPVPMPTTEFHKDDSGKPAYDLIAPEFMDQLAKVLAHGAVKYGARNWEQGASYSRYFAAIMRHMWDWKNGTDNDKETKLSHLAHAACGIMFLLAYQQRGLGTDDRIRRRGK